MSDSFLINNKLRVKESNTNLVITSIKRTNTATCAEISKDTGLSIAHMWKHNQKAACLRRNSGWRIRKQQLRPSGKTIHI